MLKLNASYSKKVPVDGQDFSSQNYHASVEVEIPDGLSLDQLQARISQTFALVRDSVDRELHGTRLNTAPAQEPRQLPPPAQQPNPPPQNRSGNRPLQASTKQLNFLRDIAVRLRLHSSDMEAEAYRLFGVQDLRQLSRKQASDFIDHLNDSQSRAA